MCIGNSSLRRTRRSLMLASAAMLIACSDTESDMWVSVRIAASCVDATGQNNCQPGALLFDQQIIPDLQRRGINPRETVCGVLQANWIPGVVSGGLAPDRLYHFRVLEGEARALIGTGLYVDRASLDPNAPYTAIDCRTYELVP
jgi:hypothetical protein